MEDGTNKSFWERTAKIYAPFMKSNKKLYKELCDYIRPHMTPELSMLELGTGPGILALSLADTGVFITATDYSEKMIAEAKEHMTLDNVHFEVADATALTYADNSFDIVLIANALHIMPHPEKALSEIYRVLRPDGLLIAPTFIHGPGAKFKLRSSLMELIGFHVYYKWNDKQLSDFIATHGFKIIKCHTIGSTIAPLAYIEAQKDLTYKA